MRSARLKAYLMMVFVVLIWGAAPPIIKFALDEIKPFSFLFYRFLITVIAFLPFYLLSKKKGLNAGNLTTVIVASFFASTGTLGLLFYGTDLTTSLDASLISATSPILIAVAGAVFLNEKVTSKERLGIFVTLIGTVLIAFQGIFETGITQAGGSIKGNVLIFASNIAFAISVFLSKKALRQGASPFSLTFMMFLVGLVTIIPFAYKEASGADFLTDMAYVSLPTHLSVWYMAFLSGALAYYLYQKAMKTIETSEAAVFHYLQPLVTAPVGVLWLHEKLTPPFILGSLIIACGVILAEAKKKRYNS